MGQALGLPGTQAHELGCPLGQETRVRKLVSEVPGSECGCLCADPLCGRMCEAWDLGPGTRLTSECSAEPHPHLCISVKSQGQKPPAAVRCFGLWNQVMFSFHTRITVSALALGTGLEELAGSKHFTSLLEYLEQLELPPTEYMCVL